MGLCRVEIQPLFISGMESLWKARRVLGFVLESLKFRLIPRTPGLIGILCSSVYTEVDSWAWTRSRLFLVDKKAGNAFFYIEFPHKWGKELFAYQDLICFLPGQPISHLFINLLFHLTFIFSLRLLKLCLKTRGCLLITILWVFEGGSWEGKM